MDTTHASLLMRLREPAEQEAWARFVKLYTPLLYAWARRLPLREQDAADLVQDVFTVLVRKLPEFDYDRHKSFRAWLRTVTLNQWRDHQRRRGIRPREASNLPLSDVADSDHAAAFEEAEYRRHLLSRAQELVRAEFQPVTWEAWWGHGVLGKPAAEVAAELGVSVNAVYIAKSRVLRRLRQELDGLLDDT